MDAEIQNLHDALNQPVNTNFLIDLTSSKSIKERIAIAEQYKVKFGEDLQKDFMNKLGGFPDLYKLLRICYLDINEYFAERLFESMDGIGTNEEKIRNVMVLLSSSEVKKVCEFYKKKYNKELLDHFKSETSGAFLKILTALVTTERSKNKSPDEETCKNIAQEMYDKAQEKFTDEVEDRFINILCTSSPCELLKICREYHKITGKQTLVGLIEDKFKSDAEDILKQMLFVLITPAHYFADQVLKSIKGAGTNEDKLNTMLVFRAGKDIDKMKEYFKKINDNKDFIEEILDDVSGPYGKLLMLLIGEKEAAEKVDMN